MKRNFLYAISLAAVIALAGTIFLVACSSDSKTSEEAAEEGLTTQRSMADTSDYAFYGYESESDVGSEELGDPLEARTLDFTALLANETAIDSLIIAKNEYLFPVTVRGSTIETIRVKEENGEWEYLASESKDAFEKAIETITANSLVRDDCYLLELEEVELLFLGYEENGHATLIPLYTGAASPFVVGTKYVFTDIASTISSEVSASQSSYNDMLPTDSENIALPEQLNSAIKAETKARKLLSVSLISQEQNQWCWAATGRMTMLFAGGDSSTITQCAQANGALTQTTCCTDGTTSSCNKPNWPRYSSWGFTASKARDDTGLTPTWETFKGFMDAGNPLAFLWKWDSGGGHYMVAVGYYEDTSTSPATQMVLINNPWPPSVGKKESITFEKWLGGSDYNNLLTVYFYNITKN